MKYDGNNFEDVLKAHYEWVESDGKHGSQADFTDADFRGQVFPRICLYGAILRRVNFCRTDLYMADMRKSDLTGANFFQANLYFADLRGAIGVPFIPTRCPEEGAFIAWKKVCRLEPDTTLFKDPIILKLLIPEDARRVSLLDGEIRADKAIVLEVQDMAGNRLEGVCGLSAFDHKTVYAEGETIHCAGEFGEDRFVHQAPGIFFYTGRQEAVEYLTAGTDPEGKLMQLGLESAKKWLEKNND